MDMELEPMNLSEDLVIVGTAETTDVLVVPGRVTAHLGEADGLDCGVSVELEVFGEDLAARSITITSTGDEPVTSALIRSVPVARVVAEVVRAATHRMELVPKPDGGVWLQHKKMDDGPLDATPPDDVELASVHPPSRANSPSDEILLKTSQTYDRLKARKAKSPMAKTGEEVGIAKSTVSKYLRLAEERGLR